jgi:hypothetical protein
MDAKTALHIYKVHREYVEHEDRLVNYRMTWLLAAQAFLLASFGLVCHDLLYGTDELNGLNKIADAIAKSTTAGSNPPASSFDYMLALSALTAVGFFIAVFAGWSTWCALWAINELNRGWNETRNELSPPPGRAIEESARVVEESARVIEESARALDERTLTVAECALAAERRALSAKKRAHAVREVVTRLPDITGGGNDFYRRFGHLSAWCVPIIFLIWWAFALAWIEESWTTYMPQPGAVMGNDRGTLGADRPEPE